MNRKFLTRLIYLLFSLAIVILYGWMLPWGTAQPESKPIAHEVRGVWLTNVGSAVLYVPWGINRALHQLAQLNFNTVYPVVWNRGYTFYPSEVAKSTIGRSQDPFLSTWHFGRDVFAEIVNQGNQSNLRIIPWFEYGFVAPIHSDLVRLHPNWLTVQNNGARTMTSSSDGLPNTTAWLNPFHPNVQQFILDLVTEVVTRYNVAGIQLDDHFGLPVQFGYDSYTVQLYKDEHQGIAPPENPYDPEWMRWRADKLSAFMQRLSQTVKDAKPDCIVSLSPNSQGFSYQNYLQDWQRWVEQGWVQELVLQVYRQELDSFLAELNQAAVRFARQHIPVAIGIYTGSPRQPTTFQQIQEQVETVRSQGFQGVSFFYWETLWGYLTPESPRERRLGFQKLFSNDIF